MSTQAEVQKTDTASEDADVLNDVISVCRDGEALYSYAAAQVQDQRSRNLFSDMARVRSKIVEELEAEVADRGVKPIQSESLSGRIRRWYLDAMHTVTDYHDKEFINELQETENRSVVVLRTAVSQVKDEALVMRLSSLVASFQIAHDRMRLLKESY